MLLSGKKCLITGGNRGIGAAIAKAYAKEGAELVLVAQSELLLKQVAAECKSLGAADVELRSVDFTSSAAVQRLGEDLAARGGVDVLVNNAGVHNRYTCLEGDPDLWEDVMAINVNAPMRLTRLLGPKMKANKCGVIINVCSTSALDPHGQSPAYGASKFALRGWTLSCYETMRDHGVKVMVVNPGPVRTDLMRGRADIDFENIISPDDVAEVALLPFKTSTSCCPVEVTLRTPACAVNRK